MSVIVMRHAAEVVQTVRYGQSVWVWVCACGADGGPFTRLQTAVTLAEDHRMRMALARELVAERFMTGVRFS